MCDAAPDVEIRCTPKKHIGKEVHVCANDDCEHKSTTCKSCGFISGYHVINAKGLICRKCCDQEKIDSKTRTGSEACNEAPDKGERKGISANNRAKDVDGKHEES